MASEQGFVGLKVGDVSSGSITITPAEKPTSGTALVERVSRPGRMTKLGIVVTVSGNNLVCKLPRWVVAGDKVHWTSYNS